MKNNYQAGWQTHPGTYCGHYFPAGEIVSLCKRERRTSGGEILEENTIKCRVCQERSELSLNGNLFA